MSLIKEPQTIYVEETERHDVTKDSLSLVSPVDTKLNVTVSENQHIPSLNTGTSLGPLTHTNSFSDVFNVLKPEHNLLTNELFKFSKVLQTNGVYLTKVTRSEHKLYCFKLNQNNSKILWKSNVKYICLDSIKDIRIGHMASNYMEEYGVTFNTKWITLLYITNKKLKVFHAIAKTEEDFHVFYRCICGIVKVRKDLMESMSLPDHERFAQIHWHNIVSFSKDDQLKDTLTFEQVKTLCDKFHIYCSVTHLKSIFDKADNNHNHLLNFSEFQHFVKLLKERHELTEIWKTISWNKKTINLLQFSDFMRTVQGEKDMTDHQLQQVFNEYAENGLITQDSFTRFLNDQPYLHDIVQSTDYSKPLNHYFIASSHNTYLLGKQYAETPSVEGYVQALQQGCRCVEIDIWDGETGPVVCHGILTASIPLLNVVKIIKKYAFIVSPYPLILSLEVHCNKENQQRISQILKETLDNMIYNEFNKNTMKSLPSPNDLKHRIIIKVKKPRNLFTKNMNPNNLTDSTSKNYSSSSIYEYTSFSFSSSNDSEIDSITDMLMKEKRNDDVSQLKLIPNVTTTSISRIKRMGLKKKAEISTSIFEISNIHGLKFRNFSLPESKTIAHCFSLNEKKFESLQKDPNQVLSMDKHNRRFLMRIYPHSLRYNSTNFNPIKFWKSGVQMVATNWQTNDVGQQINLAMFQSTNQKNTLIHSGYVLKPEPLLQTVSKIKEIPEIYNQFNQKNLNGYYIQLKILSGQLLPRLKKDSKTTNNFGLYVSVEFITDDLNSSLIKPLSIIKNGTLISETSAYSLIKEGNGFNPVWDMELSIQLKKLYFVFLRLVVKTNDTSLATCCIKLDYLKRGYRHIPLYSLEGERYIFSTIFLHSQIFPAS